ncbi:MAG: galactitol-1-phosphate 5-dehydrogenase [Limnochordia bacterium]
MKALVLEDYKKLVYKDVPVPQIKADEVLINVKASSICGSDVHGYDGSSGRRIPPVIMGHEASGVIAEVGSQVKNFQVGERVTFDSTIYCGQCHYCRQGLTNLCSNRSILGVSCPEYRRDGTFAQYVAVPERILYRIPDNVSFEDAAMVEPLSVAFHAINITDVKLGDTVLVIGAGTIGLLIIKLLRVSNAARIIVSDLDEEKLKIAKECGADFCFGPDVDLLAEVEKLTGEGVDVAFEAVGINVTVQNAINATRKGGTVTLVGNVTPEVQLPLQKVVTREIRLQGSCASAGEYDRCLAMMDLGLVNMDGIISQVAPLEEGQEWFDRLYRGERGIVKVVLTPPSIG